MNKCTTLSTSSFSKANNPQTLFKDMTNKYQLIQCSNVITLAKKFQFTLKKKHFSKEPYTDLDIFLQMFLSFSNTNDLSMCL